MHRLGLALSGGGFRATLYHLGVVRFLRDAEILPKITHITAVSGGSILGAHLALNWDKYCGSGGDFEEAAGEIVRYVQLDVRNRIVRRFPFASATNTVRRLFRMRTARELTRAGLLERHYERFLYGDTALSQLPDRPRLHLMATDLSEGCLCSFNQGGLLLQRRTPGRRDRFERFQVGLATVPMAVAASSAFPGFFPPLELNGWDVGANAGEFNRHAFTDGGVYDNLGLRMFRCIEQSWVRDAAPLRREDFLELENATSALMSAANLPENTPLRRLREMLASHDPEHLGLAQSHSADDLSGAVVRGLWDIIRSEELFLDAAFQGVELADPSADSLLKYLVESGRKPDLDDRFWLNRQIIESALRQVIGKPCLRLSRKEFDGILLSDAGGKFKVARDVRAGGLIKTALRSSDILMDRVWQLELEAFENTPGVLFFPISEVVRRPEDRFAPDPEIQRQAARIRTDMDMFSDLEISALVQHGYCVARKTCRTAADFFKTDIPTGAPWDPFVKAGSGKSQESPLSQAGSALQTARRLRNSSMRRVWSSLLSLRDWPTYVWIPLFLGLAISLPYAAYRMNRSAQQQRMVLSAIAETSPVYRKILSLLEHGPGSTLSPLPYAEVTSMDEPDFSGFEIASDTRIFDLRGWVESARVWPAISYNRTRIRRTLEPSENTHLQIQRHTNDETLSMSCPTQSVRPKLSRMRKQDGSYLWELDLDFSRIPIGGDMEVVFQASLTSEVASAAADQGRFNFTVPIKTGLVQIWMLMPEGRNYDTFEVRGYPIDKPELTRVIVPHSNVQFSVGSLATFRLINPEADYHYECSWTWSEEEISSD